MRLRWYQSWIVRAAIVASLVILCGYVTSGLVSIQGIDSLAALVHQQDIEASLGDHLRNIKEAHNLQRELILERLKQAIPHDLTTPPTPAAVKDWLSSAHIENLTDLGRVELRANKAVVDAPAKVYWLDRDRLQVYDVEVEFPRGPLYEAFRAAEDIRQRYQLIGAKLDESIRPTLVRYNVLILMASFLILGSLFLVLAQVFRKKVSEVIQGLSTWSEKDPTFRFNEGFSGELALITRQFNKMADEVEHNRQRSLYLEKIASWQTIARKLAHEIKNPLTPIQMLVSQLVRRYQGDDLAFRDLLVNAQSIIGEEVASLRRMVDNFSEFARLPSADPKPADLGSLCRQVRDLQQAAFAQHNILYHGPASPVPAMIDEALVRQVVSNLIKNAAEASGEKQGQIEISLKLENTPKGVMHALRISDNGPGIPAELKDRIFEAYFTTKHTGPNPGMGLGLAICQKIVMEHGGTMAVESIPGKTVFTIYIPVAQNPESLAEEDHD